MIGTEIRRRREEMGLTGAQLAARAGMAPSAVSQIETGKRSPSSSSVMKLAQALGVEAGELFPKAQMPLFRGLPEQETLEERRADVNGPDDSVWGAPQNRPGSEEQLPESAGHHIRVEIRDGLNTEPARVTITRTAFLDMLRRHGLARVAAEEVIEELEKTA